MHTYLVSRLLHRHSWLPCEQTVQQSNSPIVPYFWRKWPMSAKIDTFFNGLLGMHIPQHLNSCIANFSVSHASAILDLLPCSNEWVKEGRKEGMNESINQSINESINESINRSINQLILFLDSPTVLSTVTLMRPQTVKINIFPSDLKKCQLWRANWSTIK